MSFAKLLPVLPVVQLVVLFAPLGVQPEKPRSDADIYEIRLADGSNVKMRLLTEEIEIATRYGNLKVPLADVRRIDVGFRYAEGTEKKVEVAVGRLGSSDFKVREAAGAELLRLRELAYPALKRALKSDDNEVKRRAAELLHELEEKVPAERLRMRDYDVVYTTHFPIAGQIKQLSLKGRSPVFGDVTVQFADTRQVRSLVGPSETEVTVDAGRCASPTQDQWQDTDIEVEKGTSLKLRASGSVNLNPQNGNNFVSGPDGSHQFGNNGQQFMPGTLIGRIGKAGPQFRIGSQYNEKATHSGKLQVRIGSSPWGQMAVGTYTLTASIEPGLGGLMDENDNETRRANPPAGTGGGRRGRRDFPVPAPNVQTVPAPKAAK